jgi:hypothetical protein
MVGGFGVSVWWVGSKGELEFQVSVHESQPRGWDSIYMLLTLMSPAGKSYLIRRAK